MGLTFGFMLEQRPLVVVTAIQLEKRCSMMGAYRIARFVTSPFSLVVIVLAIAGCQDDSSVSTTATLTPIDLLWKGSANRVRESWHAYYLNGAKVGHRHWEEFEEKIGDQTFQRIVVEDLLEIKRFGRVNKQQLVQVSVEDQNGNTIAVGYELSAGADQQRFTGEITNGRLRLQRVSGGPAYEKTLPWDGSVGGPFAVERSLSKAPMKPMETRAIRQFNALVNSIATLELRAEQPEEITVHGEARHLLKLIATNRSADGWATHTEYWIDNKGEVQRSIDPFMKRETVRVTQEIASAPNESYRVDIGFGAGVHVAQEFPNASESQLAAYRVKLETVDPLLVFKTTESLRVHSLGKNEALIVVRQLHPDTPLKYPEEQTPPTDADRLPNDLIDWNDTRVQSMAEAAAGSIDDPWQAAKSLERYINLSINEVEFETVFDSASQVAKRMTGDCSEHAVLLAATCRAVGIPARVVVGLIFDEAESRFLYHMWNEVWIKDRWVPLDATIGKGKVGADHIRFRDSSLAGQTAFSMITPIVGLVGQLEIKIEGVDDSIRF